MSDRRSLRLDRGWILSVAAVGILAGSMLPVGCSARRPELHRDVRRLVVLPIEPVAPVSATADREEPAEPLPDEAGAAVTAAIYGQLAERPNLPFVPDLTVATLVESSAVRRASSLPEKALALAAEAEADFVLFGTVTRFRERVGTAFHATVPASVSFQLRLVEVATGEVLWQGRFDRTQEPLTSNLLDAWMFWRAGPRWFSVRELAALGVERLLDDLSNTLGLP